MASWASRIPDFKDVFAANYAFYWGLILFMIPVREVRRHPLGRISRLQARKPERMVQVSILGICYHPCFALGLAHGVLYPCWAFAAIWLRGLLEFVRYIIQYARHWKGGERKSSWQNHYGHFSRRMESWGPVPAHLIGFVMIWLRSKLPSGIIR